MLRNHPIRAEYDVIVVGGGHAGCEAAAAAWRMGAQTALITHRLSTVGVMSCNPAIGGIGKGHLVREIDALDGLMARAADLSGIHFKVLNRSRGPAVRGPRVQADRTLYRSAIQGLVAAMTDLSTIEASVADIVIGKTGKIEGIRCLSGDLIRCSALILTTGTFLDGVIHIGTSRQQAGRFGEAPALGLTRSLQSLGFSIGRLKTGTPPRLLQSSIDLTELDIDGSDPDPEPLSFLTNGISNPLMDCLKTHTTEATHAIIRENLHQSAIYGGMIQSKGPRYCPSVEDKVVRFPERASHHVFLEPEGLSSPLIYPNGVSTSLPLSTQLAFIRSIPGLGHARITQAGYAIEYAFVDPRGLNQHLQADRCPGLFLAGQINGTTGYEEAAAQGLAAGINAALLAANRTPMTFSRCQSYIGVLIDDIVTQGVNEPYRMFTSRSEYRLSLRADNADLRLTEWGMQLGCIQADRWFRFQAFRRSLEQARSAAIPANAAQLDQSQSLVDLLEQLACKRIGTILAADALYAGYLSRQEGEIRSVRHFDSKPIDATQPGFLENLSTELRAVLLDARPATLAAASRLPGMTPVALALLSVRASHEATSFT